MTLAHTLTVAGDMDFAVSTSSTPSTLSLCTGGVTPICFTVSVNTGVLPGIVVGRNMCGVRGVVGVADRALSPSHSCRGNIPAGVATPHHHPHPSNARSCNARSCNASSCNASEEDTPIK